MELILSSLSASFAVLLPNGSVGVTHISVSLVTKSNVVVIMSQEKKRKSCLNVKENHNAH